MKSKPKALIQKRFHKVLVELYEDEIEWNDEEDVDLTDLTEIHADNSLPEVTSIHVLDDDFEV